jgi:hypothetical protein
MRDLKTATERLKGSGDSLVLVKKGRILLSRQDGGIRPLFNAVTDLGEEMRGSCVADKVIGKAAAALCIFGGVSGIYTPVISRAAAELLAENGIVYSADLFVTGILNRDKSDLCPLERLTAGTNNWMDIVEIVREFMNRPPK